MLIKCPLISPINRNIHQTDSRYTTDSEHVLQFYEKVANKKKLIIPSLFTRVFHQDNWWEMDVKKVFGFVDHFPSPPSSPSPLFLLLNFYLFIYFYIFSDGVHLLNLYTWYTDPTSPSSILRSGGKVKRKLPGTNKGLTITT